MKPRVRDKRYSKTSQTGNRSMEKLKNSMLENSKQRKLQLDAEVKTALENKAKELGMCYSCDGFRKRSLD